MSNLNLEVYELQHSQGRVQVGNRQTFDNWQHTTDLEPLSGRQNIVMVGLPLIVPAQREVIEASLVRYFRLERESLIAMGWGAPLVFWDINNPDNISERKEILLLNPQNNGQDSFIEYVAERYILGDVEDKHEMVEQFLLHSLIKLSPVIRYNGTLPGIPMELIGMFENMEFIQRNPASLDDDYRESANQILSVRYSPSGFISFGRLDRQRATI